MLPEKHLRDMESSRKRRKTLSRIVVSSAFLASFLFLGQLLHELSHIIPLEAVDCSYSFSYGFSPLGGAHALVQPLCSPDPGFLMFFYPAGYLSTLAAGWGFLLFSRKQEGFRSDLLAASGTGMLMSILLSIGSEGDIESFLDVTGLDSSLAAPVSLLVVMLVLAVSFSGIKIVLED
ncbi:MAG: hypothetical protein ABEJ62_02130 [Candidatus Nanohaloarchaea archaeon]